MERGLALVTQTKRAEACTQSSNYGDGVTIRNYNSKYMIVYTLNKVTDR